MPRLTCIILIFFFFLTDGFILVEKLLDKEEKPRKLVSLLSSPPF